MSERAVGAFLAATRITDLHGPLRTGPLISHYRSWHREICERLAQYFPDLQPAELFITCTANARSELLSGDGLRTIVHDQHLGRTLNRMTAFVVRDWPASRVHGWAFERLATRALSRRDLGNAQLAVALAMGQRAVDEVPPPNPLQDNARNLMVTIEEFFVLAHEVVHTAFGPATHAKLEQHLAAELEEVFKQSEAVRVEAADVIAGQMAADIAQAVARHTGGAPDEEQLEQLRALGGQGAGLDEAGWLRAHPYLYEEIACDLVATELTLERFRELDASIDDRVVLPAILMALHHLSSLEYIDGLADGDAARVDGTLKSTVVRKSAWRKLTRRMSGQTSDGMGRLYVDVTQDHAAKVGDQVLFIVPVVWQRARELLSASGHPRGAGAVDAATLRELVWSFAQPTAK